MTQRTQTMSLRETYRQRQAEEKETETDIQTEREQQSLGYQAENVRTERPVRLISVGGNIRPPPKVY